MTEEKKDFLVHAIPVLTDNIVWIWQVKEGVVVVDPAICDPIKDWITKNNLDLHAILQTHHHDDHIGGTEELLHYWPSALVIANEKDLTRIPFQNYSVSDEDKILLMGYPITVMEVPGHTSNHIAYYLSDEENSEKNPVLFCGDTLFGAGCGRLFEGTPQEMFNSLNRLNALPSETKIYCAHEYTEANLRWANSIFPKDLAIEERLKQVSKTRAKGLLSLPTNLEEERKTNLFLRSENMAEFYHLRNHKDHWNE